MVNYEVHWQIDGVNRKMKNKIQIIGMIVFLIFFTGMIGILIAMEKIDRQTELTTTSLTATVENVDVNDTGENIYVEIQTKEYKTALFLPTIISKNINMVDVKNLKEGQEIEFSIEKSYADQMENVEFISITSLKTDTKDIFSLEEYNRLLHASALPARISCIVMAAVFLCGSVVCYLKFRENKRKQ